MAWKAGRFAARAQAQHLAHAAGSEPLGPTLRKPPPVSLDGALLFLRCHPITPGSPRHEVPAAIYRETDAVPRGVGQEKYRRIDDVAHGCQTAGRRLGPDAFQDVRRLCAP